MTVEAVRHRATATVVPTPFFNPARKTDFRSISIRDLKSNLQRPSLALRAAMNDCTPSAT